MSIRLKLIITYVFCVLFSAGVIVVAFMAGTTKFIGLAKDEILENTAIDEAIFEVIDLLAELKQTNENEPEKLISESYMKEIDDRLLLFNSGLVVLYKGEYLNVSDLPNSTEFYDNLVVTPTTKDKILKAALGESNTETFTSNTDTVEANTESNDRDSNGHMDYRLTRANKDDETIGFQYGDKYYSYLDYPFFLEDEPLVYYFITDVSGIANLNGTVMRGVFIAVMILVILMILPVIILIQLDIIRPLKELDNAAKEIGKGNLDFTIRTKSRNEVGRVVHSYETMRRELKKSIEKQVDFENNRKELISSISHDLKTPMTSIKGYVEGILDGVANTEEKKQRYLNVIHQKSLDMEKLIDDLFTFSKLDLQKLPFEFEPVNAENFIRNIFDELNYEHDGRVDFDLTVTNIAATSPMVSLDKLQMKRAVMNLVQNSIKYNDQDIKRIELVFSNEEKFVTMSVKDNGIGMTEEELKSAFEMFYRSDLSRNTKTGGSGLGLAIVKQIVIEHKGKITAKSSKTKGTSITIQLDKLLEAKDERQ